MPIFYEMHKSLPLDVRFCEVLGTSKNLLFSIHLDIFGVTEKLMRNFLRNDYEIIRAP